MFELKIITPDRIFYEGQASMVEMNTKQGYIGVYPQHIPLTTVIEPGVLVIHEAEGEKEAALHSGFATILPDSVTIMAETVEWPDEIDENRAKEAKIRAERRLGSGDGKYNRLRAEMALKRALTRLEVADN